MKLTIKISFNSKKQHYVVYIDYPTYSFTNSSSFAIKSLLDTRPFMLFTRYRTIYSRIIKKEH